MENNTFFDSERDIQAFIPNLATKLDVNLNDLVLKDTGVNFTDNGIESGAQVMGLITDPFEAMEARAFLARSMQQQQQQQQQQQSTP